MGHSKREFMESREKELYLESLSIAELRSLLPAVNDYLTTYILHLIFKKSR